MDPCGFDPASRLAEAAMGTALVLIEERFEVTKIPNRLFYHVRSHTIGVVDRGTRIARAMGLLPRAIALTQQVCAYHDVVQMFEVLKGADGVLTRKRAVGKNELLSLAQFFDFNDVFRQRGILSPVERAIAGEAILVTVPAWSKEHGTVIQPALNPGSHPVTRALALADLGSPGMDPQLFAADSLTLFAEEQIDIASMLAKATSANDISFPTQEQYRARLVNWLKIQSGFARGRQALLESELTGLDVKQAAAVRGLFTGFDESIALAEEAVARFKSMEFRELGRALIPEAFPGDITQH